MQEKSRCDVGGSSFSAAVSPGPNLLLLEGPPRGVGHAHVLIIDSDVVSAWRNPGGCFPELSALRLCSLFYGLLICLNKKKELVHPYKLSAKKKQKNHVFINCHGND